MRKAKTELIRRCIFLNSSPSLWKKFVVLTLVSFLTLGCLTLGHLYTSIILYIGEGKPWDSAHSGSRKSQHPVRLHPGFSNRTCPKRYFKQTTPGVVVHVSLGVWWVWLPRGPEYIYLFQENRWPQAIPPISTHEKFCLMKVWSWWWTSLT